MRAQWSKVSGVRPTALYRVSRRHNFILSELMSKNKIVEIYQLCLRIFRKALGTSFWSDCSVQQGVIGSIHIFFFFS